MKGGSFRIPSTNEAALELAVVHLHWQERAWTWPQAYFSSPWTLPMAAASLHGPMRQRKSNKLTEDASSSSSAEDGIRTDKKLKGSKTELQRAAGAVAASLTNRFSSVKRQARKLQQRAKEQREAKRARSEKKKRKSGSSSFFHRREKPESAAASLIEQAQAYERQLDVRSAVKCYEDAARLLPTSCQHLALCSKAWSDVTYLDEIQGAFREKLTDQIKRQVNQKALAYGQQAMECDSTASLPHVAACISMGRLALFSENKAKVKLAKEAREHAVTALQKEPGSDLAHHLMGRWHWEMAQLNVVVRTLIRIAFGTALPSGSYQDALASYTEATRLNPGRLIHRVELGRAFHKLGRRKEAWRELEAAIILDVEDINAHLQKIDAETLLESLRRDAKRWKWSETETETSNASQTCLQDHSTPYSGGFQLPNFQLPAFLSPKSLPQEATNSSAKENRQ